MSTTPTPDRWDPRNHARVQAVITDSMPDIHGVVVVPLTVKSRTRPVSQLVDALTGLGYDVTARAEPGGKKAHWSLDVQGGDAGLVPVGMMPAANLWRLLLLRGQSAATHALAAWPELAATDDDLDVMATSPREDERTRAQGEIAARTKRRVRRIERLEAKMSVRSDSVRMVARDRTHRTLLGHWPPPAKIQAHARGLGVEVAEFYLPVSYPLLTRFSAVDSVRVGYVTNVVEVDGALRYEWRTVDGDVVETGADAVWVGARLD